MTRPFLLIILALLGPMIAVNVSAQTSSWWLPVDTLTHGAFDEFHPVVVHNTNTNGQVGDNLWVVFERRTTSTSDIVARRYLIGPSVWDSTDYLISRVSSDSSQSHPDIGEQQYYSSTGHTLTVVGWQQWDGKHWQIWYSLNSDSSTAWTMPVPLTNGEANNTGVQILGFKDSSLLVFWKHDSAVLSVRMTPTMVSAPETLATTTSDTMEFDAANIWGTVGLVWTSGPQQFCTRFQWTYADTGWSPPDTLDKGLAVRRPHLVVGPMLPPSFLYEGHWGATQDLFISHGGIVATSDQLIVDPASDDQNARAFSVPIIIKPDAKKMISHFWFDVLVYERVAPGDSSLVFENYLWSDTVRSTGHNQNPMISSKTVYKNNLHILIVWESNRSGRSHIYSRWARIGIGDAPQEPDVPAHATLYQNYPNPFNPETVISGQWTVDSWVRLEVFDILGRKVATLANGRYPSGKYTFTFDGTNLSSGTYLCKLTAGSYSVVRKMMLIR